MSFVILGLFFFMYVVDCHIYVERFFFWLCQVFVAACKLSLVAPVGCVWGVEAVYASLRCVGFSLWRCGGFPCCAAQAVGAEALAVAARGPASCGSGSLEHGLGSCDTRA